MDRTLLWQSIAIVAIAVGFCVKSIDITARDWLWVLWIWFCLILCFVGTVLAVNYVLSSIYA